LISIVHYLYRNSRNQAIAVLFVISLLSMMAAAQLRDRTEHPRADENQPQTSKKPAKRGPRAIAVIEFLPKGGARLVPIALWMDGRYYDASFYGANPAPMALQPETLYQGLNYGEPTGWFTVTTPEQVNGNWVAEGTWKPQSAFDVKMAEQAAKQPKKKASSGINDDSGPPVLRRAPGSGSSAPDSSSGGQDNAPSSSGGSTTPSTTSSSSSKDDSDRPTLKNSSPTSSTTSSRPTLGPDNSQASTTPAPATTSTTDDNDPDRPTLKSSTPSTSATSSRPTLGGDSSQAGAQTSAPPAPSSDENDPDRPVLHRGKPTAQSSTTAVTTSTPKAKPNDAASAKAATLATKTPATPAPAQPGHSYPAISDAGVYETRSLLYAMTPAEKEERGRPMLALALEQVRNYVSKRAAAASTKTPAKASSKTTVPPPNFTIADYDLRAFDLDFSNSPTLVLTAKVAAPSAKPATSEFDYFVTVVARVDINGQAQKVFSSVTDNNHLDAFPRLEIIDALDADANGRGDLLFRQHSDSGVSYALYRVYPYEMVKVFEGGAGM
jgi:hypothetical protein